MLMFTKPRLCKKSLMSIIKIQDKILGARETHRIVITLQPEQWRMGEAVKKLGDWSIK